MVFGFLKRHRERPLAKEIDKPLPDLERVQDSRQSSTVDNPPFQPSALGFGSQDPFAPSQAHYPGSSYAAPQPYGYAPPQPPEGDMLSRDVQLILAKIELVGTKIDALSRRLDLLERMMQMSSYPQQPSSPIMLEESDMAPSRAQQQQRRFW